MIALHGTLKVLNNLAKVTFKKSALSLSYQGSKKFMDVLSKSKSQLQHFLFFLFQIFGLQKLASLVV